MPPQHFRYTYYPTLFENVISTLRYMKKCGIVAALQHVRDEI